MANSISPFLEVKYGWLYGESGWNVGMDENLAKFSFLFDKNVDSIVNTLPNPVEGKAYFLTSDNRVYFVVGGVYYSSPLPKNFVFYIRASGDTYQFTGTEAVQIITPTVANNRISTLETLSSNIANNSDATKGSTGVGFVAPYTDAVGTSVSKKLQQTISPLDFGAVGDGVVDDGPALNKAFAYIRSRLGNSNVAITLDLGNKVYSTTVSINATALSSWGWTVKNGTIYGRCTGKSVLDMVGSRGGVLKNLVIDGDTSNRPRNGIQAARSGTGNLAFCDNMMWDNVTTQGYYSLAGVHIYGQETTTYIHCRFWNYDKTGYAAIHTGFSSFTMTSDYLAPITGPTSYINNTYINCDYRYLPIGQAATITNVTKSTTAVVTAPSHPFLNGDTVVITQVGGMSEINNVSAVVANKTTNTFELTGINSTAYSNYTSGGFVAAAQSVPTVYFARGEQHHWETSYIVNYGSHSIQCDFPDASHSPKSLWFDCLFEGAGSKSHVQFTNVSGGRNVFDFKILTYNLHCRDYLIGHTGTGSDIVSLYTSEIVAQNRSVSSATLLDLYSKFAMYDANISTLNTTMFDPKNMGVNFVGKCSWLNGQSITYNSNFVSSADGNYTPTISATAGAINSFSATGTQRRVGNLVYFTATLTVTDNGSGSQTLQFSLPVASAISFTVVGSVNKQVVVGTVAAGSINCVLTKYDGSYPVVTGSVVNITGSYTI